MLHSIKICCLGKHLKSIDTNRHVLEAILRRFHLVKMMHCHAKSSYKIKHYTHIRIHISIMTQT